MQDLIAWLRLQFTPGLGRVGQVRLIEHFGSAEKAVAASKHEWSQVPGVGTALQATLPDENDPRVQRGHDAIERLQVRIHTYWDVEYPEPLKQIPDPPVLFYCLGKLPERPALAVVGTRRATAYGKRVTEEITEALAASGIVIVSGMARGIDSAAHNGAIKAQGETVAVLGCGIDKVYPPENEKLYNQIADHGALISEYPPGTEPLPGHFPGRNRIISALSRATLVVEASRKSGSLITAEFALEQGRDVMAIPGNIDRETSYAPNHLIKQGAHPVTEAEDILSVLGFYAQKKHSRAQQKTPSDPLTKQEESILKSLGLTPRHSDELVGETGLTPMELSVILLHLELQGHVEKLPGGRYIRGRRAT